MWTPKRILILIAGTFAFILAYGVYDFLLGRFDGLPLLPAEYVYDKDGLDKPPLEPTPDETDRKIRMAFGAESDEARRKFILNINSKQIILAVDNFDIVPDSPVVKLSPFSVAMFPKKKGDGYPEINTIQCETAFLHLDKKVSNFTELTSRRVIGVELHGAGGVTIINNRHTAEKNDDIEVTIKQAPVYYEEKTNKIWSEGFVRLLDTSQQPNPTEITAKGLEVLLAKDTQPLRQKNQPTKGGDGVSGVEMIILKSYVEMHLYVDAKNGFLAGGQEPNTRPSAAKNPEPMPPVIALPTANKKGEVAGPVAAVPSPMIITPGVPVAVAPPAPPATPAAAPAAAPAAPPAPPEKSHIMIKTPGRMQYDLIKEQALFESPATASGAGSNTSDVVQLTREHKLANKERKFDQLLCDSLKIAFRKAAESAAPAAGPKDPLAGSKEIEAALALARPGQVLTLTMDADNLEAWGVELYYRSPTSTSGAQTILKGAPMHAIRDGNTIEAQELHMIGPDKNGNGQQTFAKGPGRIDILDKGLNLFGIDQESLRKGDQKIAAAQKVEPKDEPKIDDKPHHTVHAYWNDSLISIKDRDGDKVYDLLTLTGDAKFIDEEHKQSLSGQRIQVWLEPSGGNDNKSQPAGGGGGKQEPHRVEAYERVRVESVEMTIEHCDKMTIVFRKVPPTDDQLPAQLSDPAGIKGVGPAPPGQLTKGPTGVDVKLPTPTQAAPLSNDPMKAAAGTRPNPLGNIPGVAGNDKDKPRQPIKLWAQNVVAYVASSGTKKQLQELVTDGDVHVHQDGETPKDKGLDITGEMLNLIYNPLGNRLLVNGDTRRPAQLQMNEMTIIGPKVDIDQKENTANVDGVGAMKMPSNTTFDGGQAAKPGTYVTIHWGKDMLFNGKFAEFYGGVQAFQDNSSLKCQTLQVTLDKYVSFKEGQKENQTAKIEKLVCDKKVYMEDETKGPDGKRTAYRRVIGSALDHDNVEGRANIPGPGTVIQVAASSSDLGMNGPLAPKAPMPMPAAAPAKAPAPTGPLKFTRIDFDTRMFGTNKPGVRQARFYDNVEVYHQPGDDPNVKVTPNQPPKDGFYMRCDLLDVSTTEQNGKNTQLMVAKKNAFFRSPEFFGNADTIKFDESQETIIFEGAPATLFKLGAAGSTPQRIQGNRILYNRKTGQFTGNGVSVISSWLSPEERTPAHGRELQPAPRTPDGRGVESTPPSPLGRGVGGERFACDPLSRKRPSVVTGLNLNGEDETLLGLGLIARHDRQVFAADGSIGDLPLVGRGDGEAHPVALVRAMFDDDLGGRLVHELEGALLVRRQ